MPKNNEYANVSLEKMLEKLNAILKQLEDENLPLERAVELFTEGNEINKAAQKKIAELQNRVRIIKETFDGKYTEEEFEAKDEN